MDLLQIGKYMKKDIPIKRPAFTMIELIMVIMILGIVASIGSSVIAKVYEQYLLQRASQRASLKTELAAQQIANLLSYRIPTSTLAKEPGDVTNFIAVSATVPGNDNNRTMLEWIGSDDDGFSAAILPPWNGFADVAASSQNNIMTPASDLPAADTIIKNLSNNGVGLNGAPNYPAIFFRDRRYSETVAGVSINYDATCMGMTTADTTCVSAVDNAIAERLGFRLGFASVARPRKVIAEHYKLAWTAYAICPVARGGNFDLHLIYNYQPWEGERIGNNCTPPAGASSSILATGVSVFKFAESGNTFRFKICAQENIGETNNITICKEKAIIL